MERSITEAPSWKKLVGKSAGKQKQHLDQDCRPRLRCEAASATSALYLDHLSGTWQKCCPSWVPEGIVGEHREREGCPTNANNNEPDR